MDVIGNNILYAHIKSISACTAGISVVSELSGWWLNQPCTRWSTCTNRPGQFCASEVCVRAQNRFVDNSEQRLLKNSFGISLNRNSLSWHTTVNKEVCGKIFEERNDIADVIDSDFSKSALFRKSRLVSIFRWIHNEFPMQTDPFSLEFWLPSSLKSLPLILSTFSSKTQA